jgi:hypothetical protein
MAEKRPKEATFDDVSPYLKQALRSYAEVERDRRIDAGESQSEPAASRGQADKK